MAQHALTFGETPSSDDKMFAAIAHISPFVSAFIGPLIVLLLFSDKAPYVKYHATQALVFQAAMWIGGMVAGLAISAISVVTCGIGSVLYLLALPMIPVVMLGPLWGAWLAWEGRWQGFPGADQIGR